MKRKRNKCRPILLAVWPYLFLPVAAVSGEAEAGAAALVAYCLLTVAVYLANIVYACRYRSAQDFYELAFWDMLIKLCHIPFYLGTFACGALVLMAMVVPAMIFVSPMVVFTLIIVDFLLMATSSAYGINALLRAKSRGLLPLKSVLVNGIFHFLFVLDVVSAVMIFVKLKKRKPAPAADGAEV